jgi:hypothetical protein
MISIDQALRDSQLLGAALGDPDTWQTWMVVLKAAFGSNLSDDERKVFVSVAGDRESPSRKVEQLWCIAGRGSGKSRIAAAVATYLACFQKHDLDPGEVGNVLVLAASRDQANAVFNYAQAFLTSSPILRNQVESIVASEIRLKSNVVISIHTNSFRLIRGRTLLGGATTHQRTLTLRSTARCDRPWSAPAACWLASQVHIAAPDSFTRSSGLTMAWTMRTPSSCGAARRSSIPPSPRPQSTRRCATTPSRRVRSGKPNLGLTYRHCSMMPS